MKKSQIKITGAIEIQKSLRMLPKSVASGAERVALRAAGNVVLSRMKSLAPIGDNGALKASLALNVRKTKRAGVTVRIGPKASYRVIGKKMNVVRPQNYAHLVELGTVHSAANPFMRRASESSKHEAFSAMQQPFRKHLERTVKRLRKKGI